MSLLDLFSFAINRIGGITITKRIAWTGYTKGKNMLPNQRWVYFTDQEVEGLNEEFVAKLDRARHLAGIPFTITSGFRTPEKNQSVIGSVADSSHLTGLAVDLRVENSHEVSLICDAVKAMGITRRGIYVNSTFEPIHVHVDVDPEKVSDVIFIRQEGTNSTIATV